MNDGRSVAPLLREAAALVYVADLEAPQLTDDDAHHLSAVLRLRPGEVVVVSDGAGSYGGCRVAAAGGDAELRPAGPSGSHATAGGAAARSERRRGRPFAIGLERDADVITTARSEPQLTVGFSLAKGDRTDWAVAKLTELGVDRIVPLVCERTAVRSNPQAAARQHERLRRIAREASMQSRRIWLPEILEVLPLAEAVARLGGGVALAEPGGGAPSLDWPTVLVGPEGGFSPSELAMGPPHVRLGETILRIETAAVAAGTILTGLRAGLLAEGAS
ncbi:MAG: RsmE family RNA methyltransferase [Acidimicrobiales bacterium]